MRLAQASLSTAPEPLRVFSLEFERNMANMLNGQIFQLFILVSSNTKQVLFVEISVTFNFSNIFLYISYII